MSRRLSVFSAAALLLGVGLASLFAKTTVGRQPAPENPIVGRYQITSLVINGFPNLFVIDTATSKVWHSQDGGDRWFESKSMPVTK
jgi:hypothetical protein